MLSESEANASVAVQQPSVIIETGPTTSEAICFLVVLVFALMVALVCVLLSEMEKAKRRALNPYTIPVEDSSEDEQEVRKMAKINE